MKPFRHCLPLLLVASPLAALPQEQGERLSREDFARGMHLTPGTDDAVQTLLLPEGVYATLTDARLGDLRVFNGAGEEVPHALRSLVDGERIDHGDATLPLFALHGTAEGSDPLGDISLQLKRTPEGRLLELTTTSTEAGGEERPLAHLMDLGSLSRPATALRFELPTTGESFLSGYAVEASQDLASWTPIVQRATLASLDRDGARLQRARVSLPPHSGPYLRLRWLEEAPPVELHEVTVELASEAGSPARRRLQLPGNRMADEPHAYQFPSPGALPVNRMQVELPDKNTLIQAALKTRNQEEAPWRTVLNARYFRVTNGEELRNDPHPIPNHVARHWALFVEPQGGGLGQGLPTLTLEYFPHQLAFVARGDGPFTLAYGKADAPPSQFSWSSVTQMLTEEQRTNLPEQSVTAGESFELAGAAALTVPRDDRTLQQAVLWAILLLGVALLGNYCLRLLRELPSRGSSAANNE